VFNAKTHKQETQEYPRFSYFYLAAQLLEGRNPEAVEEDVLTHLEQASKTLQAGWGQADYAFISQNATTIKDFGALDGGFDLPEELPVAALSSEQRSELITALGKRRTAEIHRNVLLGVITELWVEYLTKVEALRVSIGLEAYGQRDPLVQYKTKASDMFQTLLVEVRSGVIDRVFRYLPRMVAVESLPEAVTEAVPAAATNSAQVEAANRAGRKRHRKK
jgi:preprotein translocase subunit SecA